MKFIIVIIFLLMLSIEGITQSARINDLFNQKVDSIKVAVRSGHPDMPVELSIKGMEWAQNMRQDSMYASFCYMTGYYYMNNFVTDSAMIFLQKAIRLSEAGSYYLIQLKAQMSIIFLYQTIDIDLDKSQEWINRTKNIVPKIGRQGNHHSSILASWERCLALQKSRLFDVDSATYYYLRAIRVAHEGNEIESEASYLSNLGNLLTDVGRFGEGISYYREAAQLFNKIKMNSNNDVVFYNIGNVYINMSNFDSALYYMDKAIALAKMNNNPMILARSNISLAQVQLVKENYSKEQASVVEDGLLEAVRLAKKHHLKDIETNAYVFLGRSSVKTGNYKNGALYLHDGLKLAQEIREKFAALNASTYLAELYEQTNDYKNAYTYRTLESLYQDSVYRDEILHTTSELEARFQNETKQAEIEKLSAEKNYIVLQHEQQRLIYGGVFTFLILGILIVLGYYYYRNKQRLYEKESELRKLHYQIVQTRQTALRAQMNPHFIFNCMTTVDYYILTNEKETASELLTCFADLIRVVLEHSEREMVPLPEELHSLELYLKVEQLRFSYLFDYTITIDESIEFEVPPLLLQPYVENAIIHGISPLKDSRGRIDIEVLSLSEDEISITIRDNGIGLVQSRTINPQNRAQHRSMGTRITQERIDLLRILYHYDIEVLVVDRLEVSPEHGTEVKIRLAKAVLGSNELPIHLIH